MEKLKGSVTHYTVGVSEFPTGLKTSDEVCKATGLPIEQLEDLTNAYYIPHFRCGNGNPMYKISEVKQWLAENLMTQCEGRPYPKIQILDCVSPSKSAPKSIRHIDGLSDVTTSLPGIYFLMDGEQIVYVGQSVNPSIRISSHIAEGNKHFTHSYYVPVARADLNAIEGALIRFFQPKYNISIHGHIVAPSEIDDKKALDSIGISKVVAA